MDACDVLIVGGGPAGSSCAWSLRDSGLRVTILDRQVFPRHKVCGGWITPAVLEELQIEPAEYAQGRVLQPITGFRTSYMGGPEVETHYGAPVSYGIRRFEFDDYLLRRSGARLLQDEALTDLARSGEEWIVNGRLKCRMLVGAGGPSVRWRVTSAPRISREAVVTAQEVEFEMDDRQLSECSDRRGDAGTVFLLRHEGIWMVFSEGEFSQRGAGEARSAWAFRTRRRVPEISERSRQASLECSAGAGTRLSAIWDHGAGGGGRRGPPRRRRGRSGLCPERRRDSSRGRIRIDGGEDHPGSARAL